MAMTVVFLLFGLALVGAVGSEGMSDDCAAKTSACSFSLLTHGRVWYEGPLKCYIIRDVMGCLRTAVEECTEIEKDEKMEVFLQNFENTLTEEGCDDASGRENELFDQCMKDHKEYLLACAADTETRIRRDILSLLKEDDFNNDILICSAYGMTVDCVHERAVEKCGEEAFTDGREIFGEVPELVLEACTSEESRKFFLEHLSMALSYTKK